MLTQMDGAEGLEGVFVLAATSRPDLIDAALLRPGRLDKSILIGLPDESDRLKILTSISQKLNLHSNVNISKYAALLQGYTGADLHAFMYNAHLACIHEIMEKKEPASISNSETPTHEFKIMGQHAPDLIFLKKLKERVTNHNLNKIDEQIGGI
jgi:peroxin-1